MIYFYIQKQTLLKRLVDKVIKEKHFLTKHIDMIGELLRNIATLIKGKTTEDFIDYLMENLNTLIKNANLLKKDILSHAQIIQT